MKLKKNIFLIKDLKIRPICTEKNTAVSNLILIQTAPFPGPATRTELFNKWKYHSLKGDNPNCIID